MLSDWRLTFPGIGWPCKPQPSSAFRSDPLIKLGREFLATAGCFTEHSGLGHGKGGRPLPVALEGLPARSVFKSALCDRILLGKKT